MDDLAVRVSVRFALSYAVGFTRLRYGRNDGYLSGLDIIRCRVCDAAKKLERSNKTDSVTHQPPIVTRSFSLIIIIYYLLFITYFFWLDDLTKQNRSG